eukprot:10339732-Alexandrium_andersonii.AAC.1
MLEVKRLCCCSAHAVQLCLAWRSCDALLRPGAEADGGAAVLTDESRSPLCESENHQPSRSRDCRRPAGRRLA